MERFPSGQWEQTVNLPAKPSEVRILPSPPYRAQKAGIAQLARASAFQAEGCGFEPRFPLQQAHVAQLVEHFLGKEEVHRFDPGRGLQKIFGTANHPPVDVVLTLGRGKYGQEKI